jgi:hypothetical protein
MKIYYKSNMSDSLSVNQQTCSGKNLISARYPWDGDPKSSNMSFYNIPLVTFYEDNSLSMKAIAFPTQSI